MEFYVPPTRDPSQFRLIYEDRHMALCIKPQGVKSTDEPGGVPELVRQALGMPKACVRTVHRLDQVVGGLMVLACSPDAATELGRQFREDQVNKTYLAIVHGAFPLEAQTGQLEDLLYREKAERKTYVVQEMAKGVQEARLSYVQRCVWGPEPLSLQEIHLETGRTHQIRCQFSSRGLPLVGDRKYGAGEDGCPIALWSHKLMFRHPKTGEPVHCRAMPPDLFPWNTCPSCSGAL